MRYRDRPLTLKSLVGSFDGKDGKTYPQLAGTALGIVQRIAEDGRLRYWKSSTGKQKRWGKYCNDLEMVLRDLGKRGSEPLEQVLRDAIHVFEHSEGRMSQMMYAQSISDADRDTHRQWMEGAYRAFTYAIIASRIDDKQGDSAITRIKLFKPGAVTTEMIPNPNEAPRKFRKSPRSL